MDRCADGFGFSSVDRKELTEVFKQGSDLLRFAFRGANAGGNAEGVLEQEERGSCGDISSSGDEGLS